MIISPPASGCQFFFYVSRLKAASQEAETVRREQAVWERKVGELQARCNTLEEEKYEALAKVRENVQVAEEAALQKDQVSLSTFPSHSVPLFILLLSAFSFSFSLTLCLSFSSGLVKGETESRRAGEDKRGHQTVDSGCCSSHQKRGEWLIKPLQKLQHRTSCTENLSQLFNPKVHQMEIKTF